MSGLSPVAAGILTGAVTGAATGFFVSGGNPLGAAAGAVVGGTMGGLQADKAEDDRVEMGKEQKRTVKRGVANQNALIKNEYDKKAARGLAQAVNSPEASGLGASQTGAVLESSTGNKTNLLG